jgi:hypothetical protein
VLQSATSIGVRTADTAHITCAESFFETFEEPLLWYNSRAGARGRVKQIITGLHDTNSNNKHAVASNAATDRSPYRGKHFRDMPRGEGSFPGVISCGTAIGFISSAWPAKSRLRK